MTARSKVTLVEAQRIREYLTGVAGVSGEHRFEKAEVVDKFLALGMIDTDAALRALDEA